MNTIKAFEIHGTAYVAVALDAPTVLGLLQKQVSGKNNRNFRQDDLADIRAWLDGKPRTGDEKEFDIPGGGRFTVTAIEHGSRAELRAERNL